MITQPLWILFASLTVLGALGYNIAVKVASDSTNVFIFTVIITTVALLGHLAAFFIYKFWFMDENKIEISHMGIWMAVLAGLSIVMIDLAFFMAVKSGGIIMTQTFWTIGGLILTALAGFFIFKEYLDLYKLIGIVLGITSLLFLTINFKT